MFCLFPFVAKSDGLIGLDELKRWSELQEMIAEGDDSLESDMIDMFKRVVKKSRDGFE